MAKYRKKPVVVEAKQWFPGQDIEGLDVDPPEIAQYRPLGEPMAFIDTLEGRMTVSIGDWIITGVKGEHYPCKPDIFAATYELAEE